MRFYPSEHQAEYALYPNETKSLESIRLEVESAGYRPCLSKWGDSPHYFNRQLAAGKKEGLA